MMNLVIITGRTMLGVTTKELAILAATYVAGKCIKSRMNKKVGIK